MATNIQERPRARVGDNNRANAASQKATRDALGFGSSRFDDEAKMIPRDKIEPSTLNPRRDMTPEEIATMRHSLAEHGQLQPIVVRPHKTREGKFEIVIGERRWRGSEGDYKWIGLTELHCLVRDYNDAEAFLAALVENRDREDLSVLDECMAVARLVEDFGMTATQVGESFGQERGWVDNRIAASKVADDLKPLLEIEGAMSKVIEANKVKNAHQRARCRKAIEQGATFKEVQGMVRVYTGKPQKEAPPRIDEITERAIPRTNGGGYEYSQPSQVTPLLPSGFVVSHVRENSGPTLATQLDGAIQGIQTARMALARFGEKLDGEDTDEVESLLAALQSESDKLRGDLKAARDAMKG